MIQPFLEHILNALNQRYSVEMSLNFIDDSKLLPFIDKRTLCININKRLPLLLDLYMYGDVNLLLKYYITHKYMSYNKYDKAERWLYKTNKIIDKKLDKGLLLQIKDKIKRQFFKKTNNSALVYQVLFVFLHEYSHGLFTVNVERKSTYFSIVKERIEDVMNQDQNEVQNIISKEIPWGMRAFLYDELGFGRINRVQEQRSVILQNKNKLEEYACDFHAWNVMMEIFKNGGSSKEELYDACVQSVRVLYFIENIKAIEDCILQKIDMSKAESVSFFDSARYSLLTYHIIFYLEHLEKGLGKSFDMMFDIYRRDYIRDFVKNVYPYALQTIDFSDGAEFPIAETSKALFKKIDELENKLSYVLVS